MDAKIDDFIKVDNLKNVVKETIENEFDSKIVTTKKEIIELGNQGYDCQSMERVNGS